MERAQQTGRLVTIDKSVVDHDLYQNVLIKQGKAVTGIEKALLICKGTGGRAVIFDNGMPCVPWGGVLTTHRFCVGSFV